MAKNWAIVVGINHYEHLPPKAHLRCAVQDAEAVRLFLHQTAGFDAENILLCSDTSQPVGHLSTRPSRSNLRRLLREEIQQAQGAEHLWLFFSGHGMVGKDRQAYLLPCDGYPNDLEETAISVAFVTDQLRHCQAKNVVMVLDMCRNEVPDDRKGAEITMSTQIEAISRQQGIITLFACSHNESSYEIREINQGAFTHVLLQGLKQHTILRQLEQYLLQEVPAINRRYGKPIQTPLVIPEPGWKYDLPLLPGCATEADVKVLMEGAKDAELEEKFEQAKSLWWQVIEASQSKAQIGEARKAIERIDRKEKDLKQDPSSSSRQLDNPIHPFALPSPLPIQNVPPVPKNLPSSTAPRPSPRALSNTQESNPIPVNPPPNPTLGKIVRSKSSSFMTRQQFLKLTGFGGGGLVAALIIGNQHFQNSQTPSSPSKTDASASLTKLEELLKAGNWKAADQETLAVMLKIAKREKEGWLDVDSIKTFPCKGLQNIDQLWVKYSNGKFGFSVQKKIYLEVGGKPDGEYPGDTIWRKFGDRVGWRVKNEWISSYSDVNFSTSAPSGHLPSRVYGWGLGGVWVLWWWGGWSLLSHPCL